MQLTIVDRIVILGLLPKEGNIATLKAIRTLTEAMALTDEEQAQCSFSMDENGARWDRTKEPTIDHEFTGPQTKLIVEPLEALNEEGKIKLEQLTLAEKFGIE